MLRAIYLHGATQSVGASYYRVACLQHFPPSLSCKSMRLGELTMGSELRQCVARDRTHLPRST